MKKLLLCAVSVIALISCGPAPSNKTETQPSVVVKQEKNWWGDSATDVIPGQLLLAKNIEVIEDGSGSMMDIQCSGSYRKYEAVSRAMDSFLKVVPSEYNLGFLDFTNDTIHDLVPLGIGNRGLISTEVKKIVPAGSTPLGQSIAVAVDRLKKQASKQFGYGEYIVLVLTDGEANDNDGKYKIEYVVDNVLRTTPIKIYTIGFCIGDGHSLNKRGYTYYYDIHDLNELSQALNSVILAERVIKTQWE